MFFYPFLSQSLAKYYTVENTTFTKEKNEEIKTHFVRTI